MAGGARLDGISGYSRILPEGPNSSMCPAVLVNLGCGFNANERRRLLEHEGVSGRDVSAVES